ncbi:hypothetical protein FPK67_20430, partial [Acinetobacter baumannii]|nr:hypothetical protein [Acinetobacter baumannii]
MDCSAEEQMVRMALSSNENVEQLYFDLPNRNLKVLHSGEVSEISKTLDGLGFGSKLDKTDAVEFQTDSNETSTFVIPKMDCSAEEQMVRMALTSMSEVKGLA